MLAILLRYFCNQLIIDRREVAGTPPGGSNKGRRDREGEDIGPPETEYGRAIRCNAADYGTLCGDELTGGGHGSPKDCGNRPE